MTSLEYSESRRRKISDDRTHDVSYYEPQFQSTEEGGTVHLCFMGRDGAAISMTSSINT